MPEFNMTVIIKEQIKARKMKSRNEGKAEREGRRE